MKKARYSRIENKQARFDYAIIESFEVGLVLMGDEIKAVRSGRANLKGSYARIYMSPQSNAELFLVGAHFHSTTQDPYRTRKLLMHKKQLEHLIGKINEKKLTLVPLTMYIKKGRAKLELALARGKREFDKREAIKKRDLNREASFELAQKSK